MRQRYVRAVGLIGPKIIARTPGLAVEGYWLDGNLFFFMRETFDLALDRVVATPSIADSESGTVSEIISLEVLATMLSEHAKTSIDVESLSSATFDMPDRHTLAVAFGGANYLFDRRRQQVVVERRPITVPELYSPDGHYACFVKEQDLWRRERSSGDERPMTTDGTLHHAYGQQPESCLAAVSYRKHPSPVGLWSPDSKWFLTHRIDERSVPESALLEHVLPGGVRPRMHRYKAPAPGDPLPMARYVAIHAESGRKVTFAEFPTQVLSWSPFTWRMVWFSGRDTAWFLRIDRHGKQADLIKLDLEQGTSRVVVSESVDHGYIDLHPIITVTPNVRTLTRSDEVIWTSERDGWAHLYLFDADTGKLKNRITRGEWLVRDILHVDEENRKILFLACGVHPNTDPARRSLCSVNLDGSSFAVLRTHDGDIFIPRTEPGGLDQARPFCPSYAHAGVSPDGSFAVVRYTSVQQGNRTDIVDLRSQRSFTIASTNSESGAIRSRQFAALAADGKTPLYGVMFFPWDFEEGRRYPLVDYIYPGPQITQQPQAYRAANAMQAHALAELGFVTIMLDTRGMPFRNRALHQVGYGELLEPQLADHAAVVRQLCERYTFVDSERIGIFGQSGGGAATARALLDYGDIFKVGVSVCGNHQSDLQSAFWSDKYRGPYKGERWIEQSASAAAHKLRGKLLLISGDMDENVHVSHTLALVDGLIRANRDFDLLIVPNEGHTVLMTNGYVQRRVWDYFVQHLLGEIPPQDFRISFAPHEVARFEKSWLRAHWQ